MPSISELEALKPEPGQYSSPEMYQQDLAYWEEQIVPILRSLQSFFLVLSLLTSDSYWDLRRYFSSLSFI